MSKIVVYTCITGKYDWLLPPLFKNSEVDYVCFSDSYTCHAKGWQVLPIPDSLKHLPSNLINRYIKIFPNKFFNDYEWSIYVDGNLRILGDLTVLVKEMEEKGERIGCPKHPDRSNIREEISACKQLGKFSPKDLEVVDAQFKDYLKNGMPFNQPLTENNLIVRNHNCSEVKAVMEAWWKNLEKYTKRDQISLPYVVWRHNILIKKFSFSANVENKFVRKVNHRDNGSMKGCVVSYISARRYDCGAWYFLYSLASFSNRFISFFKRKF